MAGGKLFNICPEEEFQPRIARIITDKKPKWEGLGAFSSEPILEWGAVADHPNVIYPHPTLSFANKASEKGWERSPSVPVGDGRGSP